MMAFLIFSFWFKRFALFLQPENQGVCLHPVFQSEHKWSCDREAR
ncbi:MAG: hypothetical protein JWQ40_2442 [Segetibacter sp.]|nr:hypothetical protein [Segetibacter sp.]